MSAANFSTVTAGSIGIALSCAQEFYINRGDIRSSPGYYLLCKSLECLLNIGDISFCYLNTH